MRSIEADPTPLPSQLLLTAAPDPPVAVEAPAQPLAVVIDLDQRRVAAVTGFGQVSHGGF